MKALKAELRIINVTLGRETKGIAGWDITRLKAVEVGQRGKRRKRADIWLNGWESSPLLCIQDDYSSS